jgi:hypothetical protein
MNMLFTDVHVIATGLVVICEIRGKSFPIPLREMLAGSHVLRRVGDRGDVVLRERFAREIGLVV